VGRYVAHVAPTPNEGPIVPCDDDAVIAAVIDAERSRTSVAPLAVAGERRCAFAFSKVGDSAPSAVAVVKDARRGVTVGVARKEHDPALLVTLVRHAERAIATRPLTLWLANPGEKDEAALDGARWHRSRTLYQLRLPLPLEQGNVATPEAIRHFRPGVDDAPWVALNNASFATHPDQSNWTLDDLHAQMKEPWFDEHDFLLYDTNGTLKGFCWTKVHSTPDTAFGEIYIIGVHPTHHKGGVGKVLTKAGLHSLAAKGCRIGMLYVESTNEPALAMYRSLGFSQHHSDSAYVRET